MKPIRAITIILLGLLTFSNVDAQRVERFRLFYSLDKHQLSVEQLGILDNLVPKLQSGELGTLSIVGYCDAVGSTDYNKRLSQRRAQFIKSYLVNQGVEETRILSWEGRGELPSKDSTESEEPMNRRVDLIFDPSGQPVTMIDSDDLKPGAKIRLGALLFIPGRHYPRRSSKPQLDELVRVMTENKSLVIEIQGHVCCSPDASDGIDFDTGEKNLSVNRARYVYEYLKKNGIDDSRMTFAGFGHSRPVVEERTPDDEHLNRRVEIEVVSFLANN